MQDLASSWSKVLQPAINVIETRVSGLQSGELPTQFWLLAPFCFPWCFSAGFWCDAVNAEVQRCNGVLLSGAGVHELV